MTIFLDIKDLYNALSVFFISNMKNLIPLTKFFMRNIKKM